MLKAEVIGSTVERAEEAVDVEKVEEENIAEVWGS